VRDAGQPAAGGRRAPSKPAAASRILVSVQDNNGPVTGLSTPDFLVHVWARTTAGGPAGPGIPYYLGLNQVSAPIASMPNGFYQLDVAPLPGSGPTPEDPQGTPSQTPEQLGALVYTIIVRMQTKGKEQRGEAIAVTPAGY
jgi:hypothetical protein